LKVQIKWNSAKDISNLSIRWLADGAVVGVLARGVSIEESLTFPRNLIWWGKKCGAEAGLFGRCKGKGRYVIKVSASNSIGLRNNNAIQVLFEEEDTLIGRCSS
jgi:hypothetical protein